MRLSLEQRTCIRTLVQKHLGEQAHVSVFGSRLRDTSTGGDIDLLIDLPARVPLADEIKLSAQLENALGIPVDIITTFPGQQPRPIVEIARMAGQRL